MRELLQVAEDAVVLAELAEAEGSEDEATAIEEQLADVERRYPSRKSVSSSPANTTTTTRCSR